MTSSRRRRRVKDPGFANFPGPIFQLPIKTAAIAYMAGGPVLVDLQDDRVAIAIDSDLLDFLMVSGFFTLAPELLSRTTPVAGASGAEGLFPAVFVHVGKHQNIAALGVLRDCGYQPLAPIGRFHAVVIRGHCLYSDRRSSSRVRIRSRSNRSRCCRLSSSSADSAMTAVGSLGATKRTSGRGRAAGIRTGVAHPETTAANPRRIAVDRYFEHTPTTISYREVPENAILRVLVLWSIVESALGWIPQASES